MIGRFYRRRMTAADYAAAERVEEHGRWGLTPAQFRAKIKTYAQAMGDHVFLEIIDGSPTFGTLRFGS